MTSEKIELDDGTSVIVNLDGGTFTITVDDPRASPGVPPTGRSRNVAALQALGLAIVGIETEIRLSAYRAALAGSEDRTDE